MSNQAPSSRRSTSSSILYTPSVTPPFKFGEERASSPSFSFDRSPSPFPTSSNQAPSSRKSTPSSIHYTPSATPSFTFGEQRASSPSFSFGTPQSQVPAPSNRTISPSSNTTSSTPRYTPSSTPSFNFGENHSPAPDVRSRFAERDPIPSASTVGQDADLDPDIPLPSVERDAVSPDTYRESTPSSIVHTPSVSTSASPSSTNGSLNDDLLNLRLGSSTPVATVQEPSRPSHQRNTSSTSSAPSIHITPTPSTADLVHSRSNRTESLVHGISSLRMDNADHSSRSPDTDRLLSTPSPAVPGTRESANRSPSPSRRRRSGSGTGLIVHRVEDEDPPQTLSRERKVQEALTNARGVTARLAKALSNSALHREQGSSIQSLHQQAIKLSEFQVPSSRIVGLVGDSGVGKSSLINSLLDKKNLARASNSGEACTCVVTEYHFHDQDDFIIHVDYFTLEELKKQFEDLLQAYREYKSLTPRSDITAEERENLKKKADLAINTFTSSFRDRLAQSPRILLSLPFDHALDTMMDWASQILSRQGNTRSSFDLIRQCSSRLNQLTSETDDAAHTSVWPFIRKIRVYLKAHILSKGLIIADLPGLRDLNSARQNITERYVRQCHQIFAVAMIGRATTDQGVKEVFELARHAALSNVGIICTKSDDITASEARADWPAERTRIDEMQKAVDDATGQIDSLTAEILDYGDTANLSEEDSKILQEIEQERRSAETSFKRHEFRLLHHIMTVRNGKVSRKLRTDYRNHPAGRDLNAFCVSNKLYWKLRDKSVTVSLPLLQLSGIMELRRYCIGIVADSHLRSTTEYIQDQIPALFGSVELWVQAGSGNASAERKQQILEAMAAIEQQLDELTSPVSRISDISRCVNVNFDDRVRKYMRNHALQWSTSAGEASMQWQSWHHSSYAAFCRHYGDYCTNAIGSCCWNEEAIATMKVDLSDRWETFKGDVDSYLDTINKFIETVFRNAIRIMMETANSQGGVRAALNTLTATFRNRRGLLQYELENIIENFQTEIISVHTDGLSPIRTSIIGELMENSYQSANREYGSGSDRRRKAIITSGFNSPTLFNDHRRRFKEKFSIVSDELAENIESAISQQLAFIEADLNTLRDQNVVLESERNPDFRRQLATELEAVKQMMAGVNTAMNDVTNVARHATSTPSSS